MSSIIANRASGYWDFRAGTISDLTPNGNDGTFVSAPYFNLEGLRFDGVDDAVTIGATSQIIKTFAIYLIPTTTSEDIADMDGGTHTLEVAAGTITATGWATPSIYVDGVLSSTLVAGRAQLISVTSATGFSASSLSIGTETTFFEGTIIAAFMSGAALTATENSLLYSELANKTWPTRTHMTSRANLSINTAESGLVGAWEMRPGAGKIVDLTANGNDGTISGASHANTPMGDALLLDGVSNYVDIGNTAQTVKTVSFWVKPQTTTEDFIDLDGGTHTIEAAAGTVSATGFTSPTIYINGAAGTTLSADVWSHVVVTTGTGFTASDLDLGKETIFLEGLLGPVAIYSDAKSASWVAQEYARGKTALWKTGFGAYVSDAAVAGGHLENTPFIVNSGTFKISADTVEGKLCKVIECVSAGVCYIPTSEFSQTPTEAAYGDFFVYYNKSATAGTSYINIILDGLDYTADDGYVCYIRDTGRLDLWRRGSAGNQVLMYTAVGYITIGNYVKYRFNRKSNCDFTIYSDDVVVDIAGGGGNNPSTDANYTIGNYFSAAMLAGDKLAYSDVGGGHTITRKILA